MEKGLATLASSLGVNGKQQDTYDSVIRSNPILHELAKQQAYDNIANSDKPLEDSSLDVIAPIGAGLANSLSKAGRNVVAHLSDAKAIRSSIKPDNTASHIDDISRRDAIKKGAAVGVGGAALAKESMPSVSNMLLGKTGIVPKKGYGINLDELADKADNLKNIHYSYTSGMPIPDKKLNALYEGSKATAERLAKKYQYVDDGLYKADFHRASGTVNNRFREQDNILKVKEEIDRLSNLPEEFTTVTDPVTKVTMKVDINKVARDAAKQDMKELKDMDVFSDAMSNVETTIGKLKDVRDTALSTKDPVLDLNSIKSELARTQKRKAATEKAPSTQKVKEYEYDDYGNPTGKSAWVEQPNKFKQDKLEYLNKREEALLNQLDELSKTGKPKQHIVKTNKHGRVIGKNTRAFKPNRYGSDNEMFNTEIDNGPY